MPRDRQIDAWAVGIDAPCRWTINGRVRPAERELAADHVHCFANDSAVKVLGDENLRLIARELVKAVRANVTIDWAVRENVRAQLRSIVKRILRKYGYPPDKQEKATQTVLDEGWAVA